MTPEEENLSLAQAGDVRDIRAPDAAPDEGLRMWLLVRRDLPMPEGKFAPQAGHAYVTCLWNAERAEPGVAERYLANAQPKIAVGVRDGKELEAAVEACRAAGLAAVTVTDSGRTFFDGPVMTVGAVGPCLRADLPGRVRRLRLFEGWPRGDAPSDVQSASAQAARIAELEAEVVRLSAIAEGRLSDTRLLRAGPKPGGGFSFDYSGGPIPYIAEYLVQMLDPGETGELGNYAEIEVLHNAHGALTLTLQRRSGKTPHLLRREAEERADGAERRLAALLEAEGTPPPEWEPGGIASIPSFAKWCQPGDMQDERRFLVRFDDPDANDRVFTDWAKARDFYARATLSWNCWLFAAVPADSIRPVRKGEAGRDAQA